MTIVELADEELDEAFAVMSELRTHLDLEGYKRLLEEMRPSGYRLFAARAEGRIVALAGIAIRTNFYYRRYLYVYDLITTAGERSRGYGQKLLAYLEELARVSGCSTVALSSGVHRKDAHRFYEERMGYPKASYVYVKDLR